MAINEDVTRSLAGALGQGVDQVALLVEDLASSIDLWTSLGISDWRIYTYSQDNIAVPTYRGEPAKFKFRLALGGSSPQIELIQPLEGPSIYHDWVAKHGYGLHHLGFFVPSIDQAVDDFGAAGLEVVQSGRGYGLDLDGGFAYVELPDSPLVLEAIEVPRRRRPSEVL